MRIAIYNHGIAFDGTTPFKQSLGGSESGIVYMARELASLGHDVTVYANVPREDATYRHYHQFFADYTSMPWDVVISFRSFDPFLLGRVAPRTIFWTGDACDQAVLNHFEHPALQENIDLVFCVSEWHRRSFIETFGLPSEKVVATRNGFCPELISHSADREWTRCAYTSTPARGLDILLKMFPLLRASVPALELDVFSSMKVYGWTDEADRNEFGSIYEAARQPGVTLHGSVAQPELLKSLARTGLLLYPNTFAETSCIAAIEAQASGCVVVTTARAALNETVEHGKTGLCLHGEPESESYQREFIATVEGLLRNPARLLELSDAARQRAFARYTWSRIASEWTDIFEALPARPVHTRWSGPLSLLQKTHEYLQKGNVSAASRVLAAVEQTPFMTSEVEGAKRKRDSAQPQGVKGQLSTWM